MPFGRTKSDPERVVHQLGHPLDLEKMAADLRKEQGEQRVLLSRVDAKGGVKGLVWNGRALGSATFEGDTTGTLLKAKVDSDFAGAHYAGATHATRHDGGVAGLAADGSEDSPGHVHTVDVVRRSFLTDKQNRSASGQIAITRVS